MSGAPSAKLHRFRKAALVIGSAMLSTVSTAVHCQEYSRFLRCGGSMADGDKTYPAHIGFALRVNSRMALIQDSNVLPVGESMKYVPTPIDYSMTYKLPVQGTHVLAASNWFQSTFFVLYPDLSRLNQIRISIDRRSGALSGQLLNENEQILGTLQMICEPVAVDSASPPKM